MNEVLIVGGGAAGMFAGICAAKKGCRVKIFEQNEKLGKKLFITGKGRCNFTNACTQEELLEHTVTNPKFLYSAYYGCSSWDMIDFFENLGVATKVERGNRAFPASDHSSDIIRAMEKELKRLGVQVFLKTPVEKLDINQGVVKGIFLDNGKHIPGERVIVATGGLSYPATGSTGDGLRFAREAGLTVTDCYPSLVPFNVEEEYVRGLQGLSLKNVSLSVFQEDKCLYQEFGEMLFTHFGISGPLVLTASAYLAPVVARQKLQAFIDLKPALSREQLDEKLLRLFEEGRKKQFKNMVAGMFPAKLLPVMVELSGIPGEKPAHGISREERLRFVNLIKALPMTITGLRSYKEAIITKGGVAVSQISPKTMETKKIKGLYFIGEVLDLDAVTGGFNLQIAWSTAAACASAI